jgi:hypothetical protein
MPAADVAGGKAQQQTKFNSFSRMSTEDGDMEVPL